MEQPLTGFQVASVHSIFELSLIAEEAVLLRREFSPNPMTRELLHIQKGKENGCIKSISLCEIDFPVAAPVRKGKCHSQMVEEFSAGKVGLVPDP